MTGIICKEENVEYSSFEDDLYVNSDQKNRAKIKEKRGWREQSRNISEK